MNKLVIIGIILLALTLSLFLYKPIKHTIALANNPIEEMSCDELNEELNREDNVLWLNYITNIMLLRRCELQ